jgi:6-phosphogluconate dehydrogenase
MTVGMIGLGRMGGSMARRLLRAGHECIVFDANPANVRPLVDEGATGCASLDAFLEALPQPRAVWIMVPAGAVDAVLSELTPRLQPGDTIIDGGNSYYVDDIRRAAQLAGLGLHYLDVGTSGGVWGLERGYCLMIGGPGEVVARLTPIFEALAPGIATAARTPARLGTAPTTAEAGYLHCGAAGAGHFVKMVHNGIEYGLMAAYAEGFNILKHADAGMRSRAVDAETAPLRYPEHYQYEFNLGEISELWRRGSVVASWLLDLTASALVEQPDLHAFPSRISDSGEGRWTMMAAVDESVPAPVLGAALFERFSSRGEGDFASRLLAAMRYQFGGHVTHQDTATGQLTGSRP